jgi:signal transduction histidine kinase
MKTIFYAGVITGLCLYSQAVYAQHMLVLKSNDHDISISPHAYVFNGEASRGGIETLLTADSARFDRNALSHEIDYGVGGPRGWCAFRVRNESEEENWVLKIQHSRVDTVQLYVVRENGAIEQFPITGHFQKLRERPVHALPFAYSLPIKKNETIACYLYSMRQYGRHAAILNLQTKNHFENYEYGFNVALGFVSGMVVLASFVGFFLFLFARQRLYVYYSIYALSFFFVLLADTGFAHATLFFPLDQTVVNGFTMIFYYWMGGCLGLFTIDLLQLKQKAKPWVFWAGAVMSYSFCVIAVLLLLPGLPHPVRWVFISYSYYLAVTVNVYILYVLSISVVKKEPIVYFYMAGFYFTSFIALLLTLSDFHILHFPFQNKDVFFLTPLVEILCVALGIGIHFSRTQKERINVQLALNQTQDQIITIQEDERRRIAQDLHDDVGNSLAAVRNMVAQKKESIDVEKEINNVIGTIRTISHNLMPVDFNEFSLVDIIGHLVNKFKDHPTVALEFDHSGERIKIKSITELVIYRIINELITNILKHSKASKALIQLMYQKDSLVITVEDNGIGMKNKPGVDEGIGLKSIRLRAAYIRASINVESDDKGTLVILEIPYEND